MAAGGMTSGIAATLHLVERVAGRAVADAPARQIDCVWTSHRGSSPDVRRA
jgi:transcriptional regulator GlxA family with amidase domain